MGKGFSDGGTSTGPVIAITEGGVIPATLVYLGGFYKSTELATRLAWFWGVQVCLAHNTLTNKLMTTFLVTAIEYR